jgi:NTP pyrophosphatase (non-canonical NTP hydrolase)
MDELQAEVGRWAERVFVRATPATVVAHLGREVAELAEVEATPFPDRDRPASARGLAGREAADCLLLLLHYAHQRGFSLREAAEAKFAAIQGRTWGEPDAEGVVEHVRDGGS